MADGFSRRRFFAWLVTVFPMAGIVGQLVRTSPTTVMPLSSPDRQTAKVEPRTCPLCGMVVPLFMTGRLNHSPAGDWGWVKQENERRKREYADMLKLHHSMVSENELFGQIAELKECLRDARKGAYLWEHEATRLLGEEMTEEERERAGRRIDQGDYAAMKRHIWTLHAEGVAQAKVIRQLETELVQRRAGFL